MQKERASKKQQELLSFVDGFIKGNGYGPSYREIMRSLGYKSVSTVAIHIDNLIAKGYLNRRDNSARSLEVVTTRPNVNQAKDISLDQVEQAIKNRISPEFTTEQRLQVKSTLELLGFTSLAESITPEDTDVKKT